MSLARTFLSPLTLVAALLPGRSWAHLSEPRRAYLNRCRGNAASVELPDSARYTRELVSGAGLGTDPAPWLVFGLGPGGRAERLVVSWPDGSSLAIDDPPLNRPIRIR